MLVEGVNAGHGFAFERGMSPLEIEIRRLIDDGQPQEPRAEASLASPEMLFSAVIAREEPEVARMPEFEMYDFDELAKARAA